MKVCSALRMLATIHFHDDPGLMAEEVRHALAARRLTAKFVSEKASIPEMIPEAPLRIGLVSPKFACDIRQRTFVVCPAIVHFLFHLTPSP